MMITRVDIVDALGSQPLPPGPTPRGAIRDITAPGHHCPRTSGTSLPQDIKDITDFGHNGHHPGASKISTLVIIMTRPPVG